MAVAGTAAAAMALCGDGWTPTFELAVTATLSCALAAWTAARRPRLRREELLLFLVLCWALLGAMVHGHGLLEAKISVGSWLAALLLWMGARRLERRAADLLLAILSLAALLVAATVAAHAWGAGTPRVGGAFGNPNVAAALVLPMAPLLWGALWQRQAWRRLVWLPSLVLAASALLSGSRAVLAALGAAVVLGLPAGRWRRIGVVTVAVLAIAVMSWRLATWPERLSWRRLDIWLAVCELIAEHPVLGVGPAPLEDVTGPLRIDHAGRVARHLHRIGSAESTPLAIAVHCGLVGLGLALAAVWTWLRRARRRKLLERPETMSLFAILAVLLLVHDQLSVTVVLWWWAMLLGLYEATGGARVRAAGAGDAKACQAVVSSVCFGVLAWALVQPAYARTVWYAAPSSAGAMRAACRAEPWYIDPLRWRLEQRIASESWSASEAVDSMRLSNRAVRLDPGKFGLWSLRGQVFGRIIIGFGSWPDAADAARASFRRACELEPKLPWDWLRWAQLERSLGALDTAAELAARAVRAEPSFVRGWLFLARVELDRGRTADARHALERAAAAHGQRWSALATSYERQLTEAPRWQLEELAAELGGLPVTAAADTAR